MALLWSMWFGSMLLQVRCDINSSASKCLHFLPGLQDVNQLWNVQDAESPTPEVLI